MGKKKVIIAIVAVVLIFAIVALVYILTSDGDEKRVEVIPETTTNAVVTEAPVTTVATTEETTPVTTFPPFVNGLSLKAQEAKKSNPDTVGWIRLSNTVIDYPLVRTNDNEYYVSTNFDRNADPAGWVFVDYRCDFGPDYYSDNLLTYGHNMADGSMFSDLKKYQRDESFYEANPIIEVSSLYADYQYKVFAFMLCNGVKGSDFEFWNYINFAPGTDAWSLDEYLAKINDKSLITTNVDVKEGDKFLLMSTCNTGDTTDPTRFVVLARMVRPGEDAYEGTTGSSRR